MEVGVHLDHHDGNSDQTCIKRYPEILAMQTNVFYRYSTEATLQSALSETFQEIAYRQMPHSSIVLSSLFKRFVSAAQEPQPGRPF